MPSPHSPTPPTWTLSATRSGHLALFVLKKCVDGYSHLVRVLDLSVSGMHLCARTTERMGSWTRNVVATRDKNQALRFSGPSLARVFSKIVREPRCPA